MSQKMLGKFSIKESLLNQYSGNIQESSFTKKSKYTPLRRFIDSLGYQWELLTPKQRDWWARTKRYKMFKKFWKVKKLVDKANADESLVLSNIDFFMENMEFNDEDEILDHELESFTELLEYLNRQLVATRKHQFGRRGHYLTKPQKKYLIRQKTLSTVNKGGIVSTGEGDVQYGGRGVKGGKALGQNRLMFKTPYRTKDGKIKYKRHTERL